MTHTTTQPRDIPSTLNRYLSAGSRDDAASLTHYVDGGAELVTPEAISALRGLLPALRAKLERVDDSPRLKMRLEVLITYFGEACDDGHAATPAHRDVTFALLCFLKGFDRIPDSVPDIGLLDDAMVVDNVLQRNATVLRAHWLRRRRAWPLGM